MPTLPERPSDKLILQHLGAAVVLCWAQLPLGARDRILRQADDVIGLPPIPQIRNEIVQLLLRHAKAQWAASLSSVRTLRNAPPFFSDHAPQLSGLKPPPCD